MSSKKLGDEASSPSSSDSLQNATHQKIKKPKRLRKQLNNKEFKQFYFELVPSHEETWNMQQQDSYQVKKFETSHSNEDKVKKAIQAQSSHFYLYKKDKKSHSKHQQVDSSVTCQHMSEQSSYSSSTSSTAEIHQHVAPTKDEILNNNTHVIPKNLNVTNI